MFRRLTTVLVCLLVLSTVIDGKTKESINIRVYNSDFSTSIDKMSKMLEKADLVRYGFKKEEARTMLSTGNATNQSVNKTTIYFYRIVDCSDVMDVVMQIERRLPGILGLAVDTRLAKEMKDKKLDTMNKCKAGVEIHFYPNSKHIPQNSLGRFKRSEQGRCCCCCKVETRA